MEILIFERNAHCVLPVAYASNLIIILYYQLYSTTNHAIPLNIEGFSYLKYRKVQDSFIISLTIISIKKISFNYLSGKALGNV